MKANFIQWLNEGYMDQTYYIAWTPFNQSDGVVAISILGQQEAVKLATDATPFLMQVISEPPMNYEAITKFLDELANKEKSGLRFRFLHGQGIDPKRFSTL